MKPSVIISKKVLCIVCIVAGIIFTIQGIRIGFYDPHLRLSSYSFGTDYYTESYNASYMIFNGIIATGISIIHVLGDLLTAFGLFNICFFGIKLKELNEKGKTEIKKETKQNKKDSSNNKENNSKNNSSSKNNINDDE